MGINRYEHKRISLNFVASLLLVLLIIIVILCMVWHDKNNSYRLLEIEDGEKINVENYKVVNVEYKVMPMFIYELNLKSYIINSDLGIHGSIEKISYVVYDGLPWTKLEIKVDDILKGSIAEEYVVVYELGGYLPYLNYKEEYEDLNLANENVLIKLRYFQNDDHKIGDTGVFWLCETREESPFENNAYELVCGSFSYLYYDNDKETYDLREGEEDIKNVTFDDIKKTLKEMKSFE